MATWKLEERRTAGSAGKTLVIAGEMTLRYAATVKEALLTAVECPEEVTVECAGVTAADLSGLQLLCSAHRTAIARGKRLSVAAPLPPALLRAVTEAGFARNRGCRLLSAEASCLWLVAADWQDPGGAGREAGEEVCR